MKEREMKRCPCREISVRSLTFFIGTLLFIFSTAFFIWHLTVLLTWYETPSEQNDTSLLILYKVLVPLEFFYIIINGVLLYGAKIENRNCLLPWLVITVLYELLFAIYIIVKPYEVPHGCLICVLTISLGILLIFNVVHYYRNLSPRKRGKTMKVFISDRNINDVI